MRLEQGRRDGREIRLPPCGSTAGEEAPHSLHGLLRQFLPGPDVHPAFRPLMELVVRRGRIGHQHADPQHLPQPALAAPLASIRP